MRRLRYRFAVVGLCVAWLLHGDDKARQKVQVSKTERVEFPANGTLRFKNSTGELTIEGWDQPDVEITTTKSSKGEYLAKDKEKVARDLNRVRISTKRNGDELLVTTESPHHRAFPYVTPLQTVTNFDLDYRIRVPRKASLVVGHDDGEVHVNDMAGNIQVTARQGLILLRLAGSIPLSIDARSDLGSVNSDFAATGARRLWPFGHHFVEAAAAPKSSGQNLHLMIGFGDIVILKAHEPKAASPITQP